MSTLGRILIVEDDPNDIELTMTALGEYNLANEVVITRDGQQALDYLYCRGEFHARPNDNPAVMLLDLKLPRVEDRKSTRLNSSHTEIYTLSLHDALPISDAF